MHQIEMTEIKAKAIFGLEGFLGFEINWQWNTPALKRNGIKAIFLSIKTTTFACTSIYIYWFPNVMYAWRMARCQTGLHYKTFFDGEFNCGINAVKVFVIWVHGIITLLHFWAEYFLKFVSPLQKKTHGG